MNGNAILLGAGYSWRSGDPAAANAGSATTTVVANATLGLALGTIARGPLGLGSPDDSLGRIVLPRGVAVDGDVVVVLSTDGNRLFRYDHVRATLVEVPEVGAGGASATEPDDFYLAPRRFRGASNIAALRGALYVADPQAHRVQVFDLATLALIRIHGGLENPVDVTAASHGVYILDQATRRVFRTQPEQDDLVVVVDGSRLHAVWDRVAVDRTGQIYLRDRRARPPVLQMFTPAPSRPAKCASDHISDSAEIRDRFDQPPIWTEGSRLVLPPQLLDPCGLRRAPEPQVRSWRTAEYYVAIDTRARVVSVHMTDGRVRHRFGPTDDSGRATAADAADVWSPIDLAIAGDCVWILDDAHQTVYVWRPGAERLRQAFSAPVDFPRRWRRIADDGKGCLLLWTGVDDIVDRLDQRGSVIGSVRRQDVRARFDRPDPGTRPSDELPPVRLTRDGATPITAMTPPSFPEPSYFTHGVWTSQWLDSELYNCQWHLLELDIKTLPPGSQLIVRTRSSNDAESASEVLASLGANTQSGAWRQAPALVGEPQPDPKTPVRRSIDILVPSLPGQYLQLQIEISGSGLTTPTVGSVRLRFPRESLLEYLPAIFSKPPEQREFLDSFLSIAQTTWTGIEDNVATFSRFLDPDTVPDRALPWLAGWLGLTLEGTWTADQNRRLLRALPALRATWGTTAGLRAWLRVYLANLSGIDERVLEEAGIPGIVESFVERRRLMLDRAGSATLCAADGLWSPAVEKRFQVGVFDRAGEVELVSDRDPDLDVFRHYAHSFRVYVPASFLRRAADEALIRRAIDLHRPAHTTYELVLIEPRFLVGVQSTIALDSVIGAPWPGALPCGADDPPSRPPYQRLGYDITLGGADQAPALERSLG